MIDYNNAAMTYDKNRTSSQNTIFHMNNKVQFNSIHNILDFGCGTGNYLVDISNSFSSNCYGVEPSDGMREKAIQKNYEIIIKKGNHENIPFDDSFFSFIYMTDVIHHVPNLKLMFNEFNRVLQKDGYICISTESHLQIESRFYNRYFPSLIKNEKNRYPDIPEIIEISEQSGFVLEETQEINTKSSTIISDSFIKLVQEKGYSMFRQLSNEEFHAGLKIIKDEKGKKIECHGSGETLVWLKLK